MAPCQGLADQRHEVRVQGRHGVEVPSNALRMGDAVEADRLVEPALVVDQHHRVAVAFHLDEPLGFRSGHILEAYLRPDPVSIPKCVKAGLLGDAGACQNDDLLVARNCHDKEG